MAERRSRHIRARVREARVIAPTTEFLVTQTHRSLAAATAQDRAAARLDVAREAPSLHARTLHDRADPRGNGAPLCCPHRSRQGGGNLPTNHRERTGSMS